MPSLMPYPIMPHNAACSMFYLRFPPTGTAPNTLISRHNDHFAQCPLSARRCALARRRVDTQGGDLALPPFVADRVQQHAGSVLLCGGYVSDSISVLMLSAVPWIIVANLSEASGSFNHGMSALTMILVRSGPKASHTMRPNVSVSPS